MNSATLSLLQPIIFALHNCEENWNFGKFAEAYLKPFGPSIKQPKVFLTATTLLTLAVGATTLTNYFVANNALNYFNYLTFLAIGINGIQHSIGSLIKRKMLPGVYTSLGLILPYSASYLYLLGMEGKLPSDPKEIGLDLLSATALLIGSILVSLALGYCLVKGKAFVTQRVFNCQPAAPMLRQMQERQLTTRSSSSDQSNNLR